MSNGFKLLTIASMIFGISSYHAQNVLPATGNVGIGTATPSTELQVEGTSTLSKTRVRDTAYFEKPVIIKDSVTLEKKLTVEQDLRIKGKTVVDDNLRAKSNIVVDGNTRMKGNTIAEGNFRLLSLSDSTLSDERFLMIKPNGKVESMEKLGLLGLLYEPNICILKPDGNYYAPIWSNLEGTNNEPGVLYTAHNCPGNVGIGTNAPLGKLDVRGNVFIGEGQNASSTMLSVKQIGPDKNGLDVILTSSAPNLTGIGINSIVDKDGRKALNVRNIESNLDVFSVQGDGKVTISGTSQHSLVIETNNFNNACIAFHAQSEQSDLLFFDLNDELRGVFRHYIENGKSVYTWDDRSGGNYNQLMKLSSDGSLYAHEIKVKIGAFPDYVFKEGYDLMRLSELESYIKLNGHLPNMPIEKDVVENGMAVGELEVKLVEKVEELTLYIIELEKKYNQLLEKIEKK